MGNKIRIILLLMVVIAWGSVAAQNGFYTIKNTKWNNSDTNTYFLILKNNKNCAKCFTELSQFLTEKYSSKSNIIASVSETDSSVFARKMEAMEVAKLMPEVSLVLFEYNREQPNDRQSVFSKYKVDITPCLLVIKGDKQFFYSYEQVYAGKLINRSIVEKINRQTAHAH